jgi:ABC-type antimicrobial peptide transport system permease subunit
MVVRTSGDLSALAPAVANVGREMVPEVRLSNVVPFREIVNRTLVTERLVAQVSSAFAILGLLIACVGLYGLLAYAVVRRRREIGIRIAVGASPGSVEWMMIRESLTLVAAGVAIGVPAAIAIIRLVSSMLFGLAPGDPLTIAAVVAALTTATLLAAYLPARRAAGVDPTRALREE